MVTHENGRGEHSGCRLLSASQDTGNGERLPPGLRLTLPAWQPVELFNGLPGRTPIGVRWHSFLPTEQRRLRVVRQQLQRGAHPGMGGGFDRALENGVRHAL